MNEFEEICSATNGEEDNAQVSCGLEKGHAKKHEGHRRSGRSFHDSVVQWTNEQARANRVRHASERLAESFAEVGRKFAALIVAADREEP